MYFYLFFFWVFFIFQESRQFAEMLTRPVLGCVTDSDNRVRYYALESLFNIIKTCKGSSSILHMLNDIFIAMASVVTDKDHSVRSSAELVDRLVKDTITEEVGTFDVKQFLPELRKRMYAPDPFSRQFHLGWIKFLEFFPQCDFADHTPDILDALFHILADDKMEIFCM